MNILALSLAPPIVLAFALTYMIENCLYFLGKIFNFLQPEDQDTLAIMLHVLPIFAVTALWFVGCFIFGYYLIKKYFPRIHSETAVAFPFNVVLAFVLFFVINIPIGAIIYGIGFLLGYANEFSL